MPKKLNFLGGQQNYDESNGQYLPNLVGGDGEIFTGKKEPTKLGKGVDKAVKMKKGKNEPTSLKDGVDQLEKDSKGFNKFGKQKEAEQPKEKGLNEYTDQLFKESGTKTYTTKKGKNPKGEIVEIRRFGEGQNAIRYNETLGKVEQVWINGKRVV